MWYDLENMGAPNIGEAEDFTCGDCKFFEQSWDGECGMCVRRLAERMDLDLASMSAEDAAKVLADCAVRACEVCCRKFKEDC